MIHVRETAEITRDIRTMRGTIAAHRKQLDALVDSPDSEMERQELKRSINGLGQMLEELYQEREEARRYWR